MITTIRGKGLLNAIVIDEGKTGGHSAWDLCMLMKEKGLLVSLHAKIWNISWLIYFAGETYSSEHHPPCSSVGYF